MDSATISQHREYGHLPESAEAKRLRTVNLQAAASPPPGTRARRRFKRQRALSHALVGLLFGYLVLHPVTMAVFAWFEPGHAPGSLELVLGRVVQSFSVGMLQMAMVFAVLCSVIGAMDGYYRSLITFQRDDLADQLTVNEQYRHRLEEQNSALRELDRAKRRMTSFLVHDLKTHIGCVLGYAKLLLERCEGAAWSERDLDAVAKISRQGARMAGAVKDVLELAKLEHQGRLRMEPVQVATLLEEGLESAALGPDDGKSHIRTDVETDLRAVCDRGLVVRVLANLVSNAVRHNNAAVGVTLSAESAEDAIVFVCTDTGHGIAEEDSDELFDEFTSSTHDGSPTPSYGLGLAFCKTAVEAHGGRIWFETEPGKGTIFSFTIPKQQPAVRNGKKGSDSHV